MNESLAYLIQQRCIAYGWTLSLAESCTGGHLSAYITAIPGCSQFFLGAVVAYCNTLKINLLKVDPQLLVEHGAVSAPIVRQMAQGVQLVTQSNYSIAVSGIAGPGGGSKQKPVGTIWAAIGKKGEEPFVWNFYVSGTRQEIIEQTVHILLAQFWSLIKTEKSLVAPS